MLPVVAPRAVILYCHGMCEHGRRYVHTYKLWAAAGIAVFSLDFRGFGASAGKYNAAPTIESLEDCALSVCTGWIHHDFPSLPLFIGGDSMGGAVAVFAAARHADVVCANGGGIFGLAPALAVHPNHSGPAIRVAARILGVVPLIRRYRFPAFPAWLMHSNPNPPLPLPDDPWFHPGTPFTAGRMFVLVQQAFPAVVATLTVPTLLMSGTDDRLVHIDATTQAFRIAPAQHKRFDVFVGLRHELLHEEAHEAIAARVAAFVLNDHAQTTAAVTLVPVDGPVLGEEKLSSTDEITQIALERLSLKIDV
eukprot:gnl/Ergobibamus_cyprinoides/1912.p1 GENE.gnl/Ergobibamus_cyprinoides/1912~~gnl/Ergobibamus_cyprinoides/1912.p1  ORF type:complete len:335 (+),score=73.31 gnl/Ergobibamus_cyprinoides/1912:85-1005(+)